MTSITVSEVMRQADDHASLYNVLAVIWASSLAHVKLTFTRGSATYTFYGLKTAYRETIRKGKCVASLTLSQVSLTPGGTANPTFA